MKRKSKAKKIDLSDLIMMAMALVGIVLAVVGVCVPFFTSEIIKEGNMALFDDYTTVELHMSGDLTVTVVQAMAMVSLILTVLAGVVVLLGKLHVITFKGLSKLIAAVCVIVLAALVITFAATYASQYVAKIDGGDLGKHAFLAGTGAYLVMAGGVVTGVALLVSKLK